MHPEGREPLADREGESTLLSQSGEEKGSDEVVPGTSVFPLSESGMSRNFGVVSRVPSSVSHFKMERGTSLEMLKRARASSCDDGGTT